jgi:hypothetical protein
MSLVFGDPVAAFRIMGRPKDRLSAINAMKNFQVEL